MNEESSAVVAIFAAALALPEAERTAYLAKACGADATVRVPAVKEAGPKP